MPTLTKKVFLSSTLIDLKSYRKAAVHACQRAGFQPLYMEEFPPDPRGAVDFCMAKVDEADAFLGVYAHRYGSVPEGSDVSITEMEYDRFQSRGENFPVYLFVMDPEYRWPSSKVDKGQAYERLERFKAKIGKHTWKPFRGVRNFQEDVLVLLYELALKEAQTLVEAPDKGQGLKRTLPSPPEMHSVPPYVLTNRFVGRRQELEELAVWARSACAMLVVEAIGGMGKSALTWEWARERARQAIPDLAGILWWSFYEGGASADAFVREALAYVTVQDPEALRSVPAEEQSQRLLAELRLRPFLLVLDGSERLLTAYHHHDPSKLKDDEVKAELRACTNSQTGDLLRQLTTCAPSKILLTTRLMPSALENNAPQPIKGVQHMELHGLTPDDGEKLLRDLAVRGDSGAIRRFLQQFGNHSLFISVLAGRILDYRPAPGNFDRWIADPLAGGGLRLNELGLKLRRKILAYAFDGLEPERRLLLCRIALLSDVADFATVAALNPYLPTEATASSELNLERALEQFAQETQAHVKSQEYRKAVASLDAALKDLEERRLLQWDRNSNTYDLHPVVRSYACDQLTEPERVETYKLLLDHYERMPPEESEEASDLSGLKKKLQHYRALLGTGQLDQAAEIYTPIATTILFSIAAYSTIAEMLAPLFPRGLDHPPALTSTAYRLGFAGDLGIALALLGRNEEALTTARTQIRMGMEVEDWSNTAIGLLNYSNAMIGMNRLAASARLNILSKELLLVSGDEDAVTACIVRIMGDMIMRGQCAKAEAAYKEFTARPTPIRQYYRCGEAETFLCELKLLNGTLEERELDNALSLALEAKNSPSQKSLYIVKAEFALQRNDPVTATQAADCALEIALKGGALDRGAQGCLARALASQGRHEEARRLVEETSVSLYAAAEVSLQIGEMEKAKEYALHAYSWAWADGLPYIHWWELERSKRLLAQLRVPEPHLTPFASFEPIPFEAEVQAAIAKLKQWKERRAKERNA